MSYVEEYLRNYEQAEQSFEAVLGAADKLKQDGFTELSEKNKGIGKGFYSFADA